MLVCLNSMFACCLSLLISVLYVQINGASESQSPELVPMEEELLPQKISWVPPKQLDMGTVDPAGVLDAKGESPQFLYVARANYHDGVIPGQWNPITETMLIGNTENEEIGVYVTKASVLHMPKGTTTWVRMRQGQQFYNMVVGGMLPGTKILLYICRAIRPGNNLVLGYRKQTGGNCIVSHAGDQFEHEDYEILCITDYGMVSGAFL